VKFRLSNIALQDLRVIFDYTRDQWSEKQAKKYVDGLWDQMEEIARNPELHRIRNDVYPGCRIAFKGRHAILYRIKEGRLEIARVLHVAMDLGRHVPDVFFDEAGGTDE